MALAAEDLATQLKRLPEQQGVYGPYIAGFGDGCEWTGNARAAGAVPEAMLAFAYAISERDLRNVRRIAFGVLALELTVVVITEELDVAETRELFNLKDSIENGLDASFSLIVKPAQGRSVDELTPSGFVFES